MTQHRGFVFFFYFLNLLRRFQNTAKMASMAVPRLAQNLAKLLCGSMMN
jgi:hypothetical protein